MTGFAQVVVGGLSTGCLYAILLLGVLLVYQVSKSVNFAYGQIAMVAGLGSWYLYSSVGLPIWLGLLLGVLVAVALNSGIDRFAIRLIPEGRPGLDLVVTLGLFLLLAAGMQQIVDPNSHTFVALGADTFTKFSGVIISANDGLIVALDRMT